MVDLTSDVERGSEGKRETRKGQEVAAERAMIFWIELGSERVNKNDREKLGRAPPPPPQPQQRSTLAVRQAALGTSPVGLLQSGPERLTRSARVGRGARGRRPAPRAPLPRAPPPIWACWVNQQPEPSRDPLGPALLDSSLLTGYAAHPARAGGRRARRKFRDGRAVAASSAMAGPWPGSVTNV